MSFAATVPRALTIRDDDDVEAVKYLLTVGCLYATEPPDYPLRSGRFALARAADRWELAEVEP